MYIQKNAQNNINNQKSIQTANSPALPVLLPNFLFSDREKLIRAESGKEKIHTVKIDEIADEDLLKIRYTPDEETIQSMVDSRRDGVELKAIILMLDRIARKQFLVDGFSRVIAHIRNHETTIKAVVYEGSINDAFRLRLLANSAHPAPLKNEEKRRNIKTVLANEDWWKWSDKIVGNYCGVSPRHVGTIRDELINDPNFDSAKISQIKTRLFIRDGNIYEMAVEGINKDRNIPKTVPGLHKARLINNEIKVKPGDVFVFPISEERFPHVLYCGDRCDTQFLDIVFADRKAGQVIEDLPYFVNYTAGGHLNDHEYDELDKIPNDNLSDEEAEIFVKDSLATLKPYLQTGSAYYVWCGLDSTEMVKNLCETYLGPRRSEIIWVKRAFVQGFSHFKKGHEKALFGYTGNKLRFWNGGKSLLDVIDERKLVKSPFDLPRETHPSPKPISVYNRLIEITLEEGGLVLDRMCGSGTTLVAAHLVKRTGIGIELVSEFAAVTVNQMLRVVPSFIRTDLKGLPGILAQYRHLPFGK